MHTVPVLNFQDFIAADGETLTTTSQHVAVAKQYIYVMQSGSGLVKVGISINPEARRAAIATGNGFEVNIAKLFGPIHGAATVEKLAHNTLSVHRRGGEWFACSSEDAIHAVASAIACFIEPEIAPHDPTLAAEAGRRVAQLVMAPAFERFSGEEEVLEKYIELADSFGELTENFVEATELVDFYASASKSLLEINKSLVAKIAALEGELSALLSLAQPTLHLN